MPTERDPQASVTGGSPKRRKKSAPGYLKLHAKNGIQISFSQGAGRYSACGLLKMSNKTDSTVAFRVRTTQPKRYQVKPTNGLVESGSSVDVKIVVSPGQAAELVSLISTGEVVKKDKFQVKSISLSAEEEKTVMETPEDKQLEALNATFVAKASSTGTDTIAVRFPAAEELETMLDGGSDSDTVRCVQQYDIDIRQTPQPTQPTQPRAPAAVPQRQATPIEEPRTAASPAPVVEETKQQTPAATVPAVGLASYEKMVELRQRYDDLVQFSMRTSAQQEELQASLKAKAMALEAANQRYEELKNSMNVRKRKVTGQSESKDSDGAAPAAGGDEGPEVQVVKSGFPLWQVLIIAIVMFFLGATLVGSS